MRRIGGVLLAVLSAVGLLLALFYVVAGPVAGQSGMPDIGPDFHYVAIENLGAAMTSAGNGVCDVTGNTLAFSSASGSHGACQMVQNYPTGAVGYAVNIVSALPAGTIRFQRSGTAGQYLAHFFLNSDTQGSVLRFNNYGVPSTGFEWVYLFTVMENVASGGVWMATGAGSATVDFYWIMSGPLPSPTPTITPTPLPGGAGWPSFGWQCTYTPTGGTPTEKPGSLILNGDMEVQWPSSPWPGGWNEFGAGNFIWYQGGVGAGGSNSALGYDDIVGGLAGVSNDFIVPLGSVAVRVGGFVAPSLDNTSSQWSLLIRRNGANIQTVTAGEAVGLGPYMEVANTVTGLMPGLTYDWAFSANGDNPVYVDRAYAYAARDVQGFEMICPSDEEEDTYETDRATPTPNPLNTPNPMPTIGPWSTDQPPGIEITPGPTRCIGWAEQEITGITQTLPALQLCVEPQEVSWSANNPLNVVANGDYIVSTVFAALVGIVIVGFIRAR